ncbi:unnamed protein product [Acanthoscelides obtectus]|uniref:Uncharacterized protein n=1 Tax=Acanthoscelides obtectus TaxID=200917 RepID=A0A9P0NWJ5_ACAOB|nr:unnamed protein product [Acanthoscelides obtectus]CAK1625520.1 hypothetical protein AOBTE_LOCUS3209 [Acanthoscelides obtectus]
MPGILRKKRESIEDGLRSGKPSSSRTKENIDRIRDLVRSNRRLIVRMIREELNLTLTIVRQIKEGSYFVGDNIKL